MCEDWRVRKIWDGGGWDFVSLSTSGWEQSFDQAEIEYLEEKMWGTLNNNECSHCALYVAGVGSVQNGTLAYCLLHSVHGIMPFYRMWDDYTFINISNCSMLLSCDLKPHTHKWHPVIAGNSFV